METREKLSMLRQWMDKENIDVCYVPSSDAHMSEYVGEHWKSREWISGFTGSAGTAVILKESAGLWTDGRYFIQAAQELEGSGIALFKMGEPGVPTIEEWLKEVLPSGSRLALDGRTVSIRTMETLSKATEGKNIVFLTDKDPIGAIWQDRPEIPGESIFLHAEELAGTSRAEKLTLIRTAMKSLGADYYLLPVLDEICWLLNIRGRDILYNPYVTSYVVVGPDSACLFTDLRKVPEEAVRALADDGIRVQAYDAVYGYLNGLEAPAALVLDPAKTNVRLRTSIAEVIRVIEAPSLVTPPKAVKNDTEIGHIRDAYLKDCTSLVRLFKWIKDNVDQGGITEIDVVDKSLEFRGQLPLFQEFSFAAISAYGDHAAMMHYKPVPEAQYTLKPEGFFLLDSGCHFHNGTTDITRTLALGPLTDEQKKDFTLVLKSVIALSTARFLYGSTGSSLDILARKPLWDNGLDYKCGTGHGVGYFSNVHEEPQRFSHKPNMAVLEKGMLITVEPGVYKEGRHGIRTENTLLVVEDETTEFGTFFRFEELCYLPIDREAILPSLLTDSERSWLNLYHQEVYNRLSGTGMLSTGDLEWLKRETAAI
ncbi:aminopeptidase P family protein [Paenibacillus sp. HW567]|uniref:aminopeptidase P family protein n=1 Tax=Paenibacillus sp. HW567 TaxID=1034769 RepID=UPI000373F1D9|nr:aminopeptidase P family protein [Paenibacillus sp. HW567]